MMQHLRHKLRTPLGRQFTTPAGGAGIGNVRNQVSPSACELDWFKHTPAPHTCRIIGAPMTWGQPYVGTDTSPSLLRQHNGGSSLKSLLSALDWRVQDGPDIDFGKAAKSKSKSQVSDDNFKARNLELVSAGCHMIAEQVYNTLHKDKQFPLILGGDHSIGLGSLAGILRHAPNTGVLWIDAHADLNTPYTSGSGNMHGMPLGLLVDGVLSEHVKNKRDNGSDDSTAKIPGIDWLYERNSDTGKPLYPMLNPDSLVYVGLRDVDPAERRDIQRLGIKAFTMHDIDRYGIGKVMDMALSHLLATGDRPIHLSYDIDAVDPVLAPATGTAVRGGLTFREAHYVAEAAAACGQLASLELVELNPTLSHGPGSAETIELGLQLITSGMGQSII